MESIRLLILDVDGVLTDGHIRVLADGQEWSQFHVHDGLGIKRLLQNEIEVAVITGRSVAAVEKRCQALGIRHVYMGVDEKLAVYRELLQRLGLQDEEVCFMGDDVPDLGPMRACGFPVTVPQARPEVLAVAGYCTTAPGGSGAVREVCEKILRAQQKWEEP